MKREIGYDEELLVIRMWVAGYFDVGMTLEEIIEIIKTGFKLCENPEEQCDSGGITGKNCRCIRLRFPTPEHYELYKAIRKSYEKEWAINVLAEAIGEPIKEKK